MHKKKERNRNNPLSLPSFALFSHLSMTNSKSTCGSRGRMLLLRSILCQASLWRGLIFMSMNRRPLTDPGSRTGLLMAVFPSF